MSSPAAGTNPIIIIEPKPVMGRGDHKPGLPASQVERGLGFLLQLPQLFEGVLYFLLITKRKAKF